MSKDGGPAFPLPIPNGVGTIQPTGMTLRDYFAAQALAGIMANSDFLQAADTTLDGTGRRLRDMISTVAYQAADAMIAAKSL